MAQRYGTGILLRVVTNRFPFLLLDEEGRLNDLAFRENFTQRVVHRPEPGEGADHRWI